MIPLPPRIMLLFLTIPILTIDTPFIHWQNYLPKFIWQEKTSWVKYRVLQDARNNLKLYFAACLIWRKEWISLRIKRLFRVRGAQPEVLLAWIFLVWLIIHIITLIIRNTGSPQLMICSLMTTWSCNRFKPNDSPLKLQQLSPFTLCYSLKRELL